MTQKLCGNSIALNPTPSGDFNTVRCFCSLGVNHVGPCSFHLGPSGANSAVDALSGQIDVYRAALERLRGDVCEMDRAEMAAIIDHVLIHGPSAPARSEVRSAKAGESEALRVAGAALVKKTREDLAAKVARAKGGRS